MADITWLIFTHPLQFSRCFNTGQLRDPRPPFVRGSRMWQTDGRTDRSPLEIARANHRHAKKLDVIIINVNKT